MKLKKGVKVQGIRPELMIAIIVADTVYTENGHELVLTSVCEGKHSSTSLHHSGGAFDARTRYFTSDVQTVVRNKIKERLGVDYDVVLESDHLHVEYQPRG